MDIRTTKPMNVSDLVFDLKNPRLPEFGLSKNETETRVIQLLWRAMDVQEIVMSIATSGFFSHEPVIVANENGKNVVIEGSRRLAAVKLLLNPNLAQELQINVPSITEDTRNSLKTLPTILGTRKDAWSYLGFKHVNGPAKWSSYAKSRYIADVHRNFDVSLDEIAKQIGDTHRTVQRLFRGFMVIEEAENLQVFRRDDRWQNHFAFSHLYTGLQYPGITSFLSLRPESEGAQNPVPFDKKKELGELFLWLYGSKERETPPVVQTQDPDLRRLDAVLNNKDSLFALRSGESLAAAYEASRISAAVFEESLRASKRNLQKARAFLTLGYDCSEELLRTAGTVATLADELYWEIERTFNSSRTKRLTEDN